MQTPMRLPYPSSRHARAVLLGGALLALLATAHAEVIQLPPTTVTEQPDENPPLSRVPTRGESKAGVMSRFGAPEHRHEPVGGSSAQQPPITRWDYPAFSVFFENETVIDVVIKDHPRRVLDPDALQRQP